MATASSQQMAIGCYRLLIVAMLVAKTYMAAAPKNLRVSTLVTHHLHGTHGHVCKHQACVRTQLACEQASSQAPH